MRRRKLSHCAFASLFCVGAAISFASKRRGIGADMPETRVRGVLPLSPRESRACSPHFRAREVGSDGSHAACAEPTFHHPPGDGDVA